MRKSKNHSMHFRFFSSLLLLIGLNLFSFTGTSFSNPYPFDLSTPGDQSAVKLKVTNFASTPKSFKFGVVNGRFTEETLKAYQSREYLLQCLKRSIVQSIPQLEFMLGDQQVQFWELTTRHSDPLKIIWNRGAPQNSNQLKWPLRSALKKIYDEPIHSVKSGDFLPVLSAWARTELFLTSLKALSDLSEEQQFVLKMMVTAGTTLVIGTGDVEGSDELLQRFTPVSLGEVKSTGGALLEQLPRVSSYRALFPRSGAYPLINTDGEPIAVESQLGLGRVRVLAVRLNELTTSEAAELVLQSDLRSRRQLEEWLDLAMPPLTESPRLLSDQVWILLLMIPLLFIAARGRSRYLLVGGGIWITLALIRPPLFVPTSIRRAHLLYIPMDSGAVVIGQADLNSFGRGGRPEHLNTPDVALISTETEGACLIHGLQSTSLDLRGQDDQSQESWWVITSDLGERQRFKYIAYAPSIPRPNEHAPLEEISSWPAGPWSGASIEPLSPLTEDLPLPSDLSGIKAWRLPTLAPEVAPQPLLYYRGQEVTE